MNQENATDDVIIDNTSDAVSDQTNQGSDASPASEQHGVLSEVDDSGVSFKNRYFELERKYQNLSKSVPQMIQEAAQAAAAQTQGKVSKEPEYSVQDYIRAKTQDPNNAAYYESKILELQEKKIQDTVSTQLSAFERRRQEETVKQQAEAWALNTFPQLRDPSNAFSQAVWANFNSRPAEKREPHDFAIAAELVAARMGIKPATMLNTQQDKVLAKERELKKLTRERAIEGDGRGTTNVSQITQRQGELKNALDKGNVRDYIQKYWLKPKEAEE